MDILIERMRLRAYHGVFGQERTVGQDFEVSVKLNVSDYDGSDHLNSTVNYARVCSIIKQEMGNSSQLIEHVASRIGRRLRKEFPNVDGGWVEVCKMHPPMPYNVGRIATKINI